MYIFPRPKQGCLRIYFPVVQLDYHDQFAGEVKKLAFFWYKYAFIILVSKILQCAPPSPHLTHAFCTPRFKSALTLLSIPTSSQWLPRRSLRIGHMIVECSVADPGCLSRILIFTHSGSRIPDPKTATKGRGEKKIS